MIDTAVNVLGVPVCPLTVANLIDRVEGLVHQGARHTVMYANVHTLNIAYADPGLRRILSAAAILYCDGAGVVLGARLLGHPLPERMTGADWIYSLCARCAQKGISLFLLGSQPGVAEKAAHKLLAQHNGLRIAGTHHGYLCQPPPLSGLRKEEAKHGGRRRRDLSAAVIAAVNAARPDILLVGMGSPLQEEWIAAHRAELDTPVVWAVGALFDFVAGVEPRGPRWMLDHGLEWLYRLLGDPRRLWHRYLVGNPMFVFRVLKQRITS